MSNSDWKIKTLGEVCFELFAGGDVPKLNHSKVPTEEFQIPIFSNGEKDRGLYGYTNTVRVTKPCITISARGTIGYTEIREEPFYPAVRLIVAIPNEDIIDLHYFKYVISSFDFVHSGSSIPQLTIPMVRDHELNLPPLSEQIKIVKILDEKFGAIEGLKKVTEQQIVDVKELFQIQLSNLFLDVPQNWEHKTLSEVCEKITDGTHQTPTYYDQGVIFLSSRNVTSGKVDWDKIKYIDNKQHAEMQKRVSPKIGDILLAKNGTTGVAAIVDRDVDFDIYVSLALLRTKGFVTKEFLLYFINSGVAKKQFNKRLKGTGVPNLHLEEIREVEISYPEKIAEQVKIVKELDKLSKETKEMEIIFRAKLADLEELKKSYLEQAFSGNL